MSSCELDTAAMEPLRPLSGADRLSVVLGAGASAASGLPGWNTMVAHMRVHSGTVPNEAVAQALLEVQDPQLATEAARANTKHWATWRKLVREALYGSPPSAPAPSPLHLAVAGLAVQRDLGAVGLFTLNFDVLLEEALRQAIAEAKQTNGVFTRTRANTRAPLEHYEVHHLHGAVEPQRSGIFDKVVLSMSDFDELGSSRRPWQVGALQENLQRGPMLLAGTSYRDPDVRQWLHELNQDGDTPPRLLVQARQSLHFDRARFKALRPQLTTQWERVGVTAVLVEDYADAAQAVREISMLGQPDYQPPSHRVSKLFSCHLDSGRFPLLQDSHSRLLDADLDDLRPHMGDEVNLTLWLANGEGQMARYASCDRMYRSSQRLRYVPTGYDSPWVAGQCLSQDTVVRQNLPDGPGTQRWRSVVAAPIVVEIPGGPPVAAAALTTATSQRLEDQNVAGWEEALTRVADRWARRLVEPAVRS